MMDEWKWGFFKAQTNSGFLEKQGWVKGDLAIEEEERQSYILTDLVSGQFVAKFVGLRYAVDAAAKAGPLIEAYYDSEDPNAKATYRHRIVAMKKEFKGVKGVWL